MKAKLQTKLKIDDLVVVTSGKDKGKRGKILAIHSKTQSVMVEGVNIVKKTLKKTQENQKGGVRTQEAAVHISNVMYYHAPSGKGVRIAYRFADNGKKERFFKVKTKTKTQAKPEQSKKDVR